MKPKITLLQILIMAVFLLCASGAQGKSRTELVDSLEKALPDAVTANDSIEILYNIYDLARKSANQSATLERIYNVAKRGNVRPVILDVLRQMSRVAARNDSLQQLALKRAIAEPYSQEQRETVTFIRLNHAQHTAFNLSGKTRTDSLHRILTQYGKDQSVDNYRRIEMLFTICLFLRNSSHGSLVHEYLQELDALIDKLPDRPGALRTLFNTVSAISYSSCGNSHEALRADSALLRTIDRLQAEYRMRGRRFRNYDTNLYTIYQRMLGNYAELTDAQVDDLYSKLQALSDANSRIAQDMRMRGITAAYYAMAKHKYRQAIPLLKSSLEHEYNRKYRYVLLKMLIEAAKAVGDDATLLHAYREYVPTLEYRNDSVDADYVIQYKLLQDYQSLEERTNTLVEQNYAMERANQQRIIITGIIVLILLVALAVIFLVAWRKSRRLAAKMNQSNALLRQERDKLKRTQAELIRARDDARVAERQKMDFINTMSHEVTDPINAITGYSQIIVDAMEDKRRAGMDRFINIIEVNSLLLRTLMSDVLDVAELENSQPILKRKKVRIQDMAQVAMDSMSRLIREGVTASVVPLHPDDVDATIDADQARLEQILTNLVSNAAKFTEKGSITMRYGIDAKTGNALFIVEDTGPGIPENMREKVFERFEKLNHSSQGIGLGLYICRVVARIMDAEVVIDDSYTGGTRMVVTLPQN